jgi:ABC-type transport system involved in Fe-S cluster assembly fused permease/ATPase subunit
VLFTFAPTAVELCLVLALLWGAFSPLVAGLVGLTFLVYVCWTVSITQLSVDVRKRVNSLDNLATSKAVDALLNAETVALFDNAKLEVAQYDAYLRGYQRAAVETERLSALLNAGQAIIIAAGLTSVLIAAIVTSGPVAAAAAGAATEGFGFWWNKFFAWAAATPAGAARFGVGTGGVSGGDLVLLQGLLLQLWAPLSFLGWFYRELRSSLVDLEEFFDVLRTPSSIPDGTRDLPAAGSAAAPSATPSSSSWGLSVELDNVHFGYHKGGREVLKGVSLRVAPGESVAIVGPSGSGKSSLLRLVTRLYDANAGTVRVGGIDVRDLRRSSLRAATAVVPQEAVLLNDSLLQNVRYGRPNATDDEVMAAIRAARLGAAVARMPEGALTGVGERGLKLSGGEKQRVAIARAFLKAPRLLVCDEASSALDSATEVS